jgi:hypothetical protein
MARSGMVPRNLSVVGPEHSHSAPSPRSASRAFTGRSRTDTTILSSPPAIVTLFVSDSFANYLLPETPSV